MANGARWNRTRLTRLPWAALVFFALLGGGAGARAAMEAEVRVDARQPVHSIDPRIYGQFVEHFGRIVNGGLWAELLRNRKFYPIDPDRTQVADPWRPERDRSAVSYAIDRWRSLDGISSQRVSLFGESREWRGVSQTGFDVLGGKEYVAYAWIFADPAEQKVSFRLESADGQVAAHAETQLRAGDWQKYEVRLRPDRALRPAVFRIAFDSPGIQWIGAASLMSADNVEGLRRDVLELITTMAPPIIRWPGGGYPDCYDWRRAIGPRDRRPPQPILPFGQPYGYDHGMDPNDFGTDEFLRFCELIGAEPYITANFGSGTPEMAAAWVEYCNGPAESKWGAQRAANGRREPYRVRHWSIGNEIWGNPFETGYTTAEGYAAFYVPIARAMRAADPSILITAVGEFDNTSSQGNWNGPLLSAAGNEIDLLSIHHYYPTGYWPAALVNRPLEAYLAVVAEPSRVEQRLKRVIELADSITGGRKRIQIAFDEWNEWDWDYPRPVDSPQRSYVNQFIDMLNKSGLEMNQTHRDGLFAARMLHTFMRLGDRVPIAVRTHMINSLGAIRTDSTRAFVTASGTMMQLYRNHSGTGLLKVEVHAPTFDVPEEGWKEISYLDAAATLSADGQTLFLHLLNLHPFEPMRARIRLEGKSAASEAKVWQIAPRDFLSRNDFGITNVAVEPSRTALRFSAADDALPAQNRRPKPQGLRQPEFGAAFVQLLPSHSATTLELHLR